VDESDVILPVAKSSHNAVVTIYLEGVKDGRRFIKQAEQAAALKPVFALKVGRSPAGKKAVSSHTGALAGEDSAYSAAFRRAGILRVGQTDEMFAKAKALAWSPLPVGNRIAVLTNAGGPGVIAADAVSHFGLAAANLGQETTESLKRLLPDAASVENPVDMLASASPDIYSKSLRLILDDPGVDMVLVIAPPPPMFEAIDVVKEVAGVIKRSSKPVALSLMGNRLVAEAVGYCRSEKILEYTFPEEGIGALSALWQWVEIQERDISKLVFEPPKSVLSAANQILDRIKQKVGIGYLPMEEGLEIARLYDLPVVETIFASDSAQAVRAAEKLGYPVVMKIAVEGISHKSDMGGILMNLDSREAVIRGYENLSEKFSAHIKGEQSFSVQLQNLIEGGQEVIVGAVRDPVFGPLTMFGSGGIEVEGLNDIQFSIAPLTKSDFDFMIENTWAGKKLRGYRHLIKADIQIVQDILVRLGQIMFDCPGVQEIEINPLIVLSEGQGAHAVDIRMIG
jgi:acetyltransferase